MQCLHYDVTRVGVEGCTDELCVGINLAERVCQSLCTAAIVDVGIFVEIVGT